MISRDRWAVLQPYLDEALDLEAPDRARWLDDLSRRSPELAREMAPLLAADREADQSRFLDEAPGATLSGMQLGAYRLERPLGYGGMGTVWLGHRTDGRFEGTAAIKILNLALLTATGQERFRREGSALARLAHPGIARLLDAGVSPFGQPFLVLEYVEGEPIDEYVVRRGLDPQGCVSLFLRVLEAVEHAHANLVIHRDIKPSNILVTPGGEPKLLDFGIAALLDDGGSGSPLTAEGGRAFTPEYAAPEVAEGRPATTASDVYSLGLLLHRLVAGHLPAARSSGAIRYTAPAPAERAGRSLGNGDLGLIIRQAVRTDPGARYRTVGAMADDLRRWQGHEPVSARAPSRRYRLAKFLRRNHVPVLAGAAMLLLSASYVASVLRDRQRIREALQEATIASSKAEQVTAFAVELFGTGEPVQQPRDSIQQMLELGLARARLQEEPAVKAQMLDLIGRIHSERGEFASALRVFREALAVRRAALGDEHPDVATSLTHVGWISRRGEPGTSGVEPLQRALTLRRQHHGDNDPRTLETLYKLAIALHATGNDSAAGPLVAEWTAAVRAAVTSPNAGVAAQMMDLASVLEYAGRVDEAERLVRDALGMRQAIFGDRHRSVGVALEKLGTLQHKRGSFAEAESLFVRAVAVLRASHPQGHPELAYVLRDYGFILLDRQRWVEAEDVWREAVPMLRRFLGERSLAHINALSCLGRSLSAQGRNSEAVPLLREAVSLHQEIRPGGSPILTRAQLFLGSALTAQGEYDEAERHLLAAQGGSIPPELRRVTERIILQSLVDLYEARGDDAAAARYRARLGPSAS